MHTHTHTHTHRTHRRLSLGGGQEGHGNLTKVVEHQEVQLPAIDELRHYTHRHTDTGAHMRAYTHIHSEIGNVRLSVIYYRYSTNMCIPRLLDYKAT